MTKVKVRLGILTRRQIAIGLLVALLFYLNGVLFTQAQNIITTLHSFNSSDGAYPFAGLIMSGNMLYGTTTGDNFGNSGTVFAIQTDGTGFTNLHSFNGNDGAYLWGGLTLSGDTLYGTAELGGSTGNGTVFTAKTNGMDFTNLYGFPTENDGFYPRAGVVVSEDTLYGTTSGGGSAELYGTVFSVHTDGSGHTNLHSFSATSGGVSSGNNEDGANPNAGVILSGNTLYGTAQFGGQSGFGVVFTVNTDGTGFTNLHSFRGSNNGAYPIAGLITSGNRLYGTTKSGGSSDNGVVFALNTDGTGFTNLHSFTAFSSNFPSNTDGAMPQAPLTLSDNILYGTTQTGGVWGRGVAFAINTDGTGFTNLYSFSGIKDGADPLGGLILSSNTLYGTTDSGGDSTKGTVFALTLVPTLSIVPADNQIVLSWPTWAPQYGLQETANLTSGSWSNITNGIIDTGANYVLTNSVNGAAFFRLKAL